MALTVQEAVDLIKARFNVDAGPGTVDTIKIGNARQELRGIACCFLANRPVLDQAVAAGANLVITHEPTFYNHMDDVDWLHDDPVYKSKRDYLEEHGLVVWRLHDLPHRIRPDMILAGMSRALEFQDCPDPAHPIHFRIKPMSVRELADWCKTKLGIGTVRFAGNAEMRCETVALRVGSPGGRAQIDSLKHPGVDVVITGESAEWETCEYVRDSAAAGQNKALIILGHANSEDAGVQCITEWIREVVPEVPVMHLVTGDPFTFL